MAEEKKDSRQEIACPPQRERHECGFCPASFNTDYELYDHQQKAHDPDGIMFSEIGLPK